MTGGPLFVAKSGPPTAESDPIIAKRRLLGTPRGWGWAKAAATALENSEAYGVPPEQVAALAARVQSLKAAVDAQTAEIIAAEAATERKTAEKAGLTETLADIATAVYANRQIDNTMLVALGFGPRPKRSGRPNRPAPISDLTAEPSVLGAVKIAWKRGENAKGTMFVIEAMSEEGTWRVVHVTTRVGASLPGFPPGVPAWFRVTAKTSTEKATRSLPVAIYPHGAARPVVRAVA